MNLRWFTWQACRENGSWITGTVVQLLEPWPQMFGNGNGTKNVWGFMNVVVMNECSFQTSSSFVVNIFWISTNGHLMFAVFFRIIFDIHMHDMCKAHSSLILCSNNPRSVSTRIGVRIRAPWHHCQSIWNCGQWSHLVVPHWSGKVLRSLSYEFFRPIAVYIYIYM